MKLGVTLLITTLFATGIGLILYAFNYMTGISAVGFVLSLDGIITIFYSLFFKYHYPRLHTFSWGVIVTGIGSFLLSSPYVSFSEAFPLFVGIISIILGIVVVVNEVSKRA